MDHGVYFDRPIGVQLTDNYRGQDRRDAPPVSAWPATWLLAWPVLSTAAMAIAALAGSGAAVTGAQVAAGIVAAGAAVAVGRATGRARTLDLGTSAAVLAGSGVATLAGADVSAAGATLLAAYLLARSARTAEVDTRLLAAPAWAVRMLVPVIAVGLVALVEHRVASEALRAPTRILALVAWCATGWLLHRRQHDGRGCAVEARGLHLAAAAATGAALQVSADLLDTSQLATAGHILVAAGLGTLVLLLVHLLGLELETRRSQQHLQRVTTDRDATVRETGIREAAHEARNALTGIEAALWGLRRLMPDPDPRQQAVTAALDNGIARLKALLLPDAADDTERADVVVGVVLDPIVWLARGRGTQVTVTGETDVRVACPASVLGQALDNLLINAHLHGDAARHPVAVRVETSDHHVDIVVHDQGPGVPSDLREAAFRPGVRRGSNAGEGLGLGLARELLREHGGELTADRPSNGASFRVRLPREADAVPVRTIAEERDDHHE